MMKYCPLVIIWMGLLPVFSHYVDRRVDVDMGKILDHLLRQERIISKLDTKLEYTESHVAALNKELLLTKSALMTMNITYELEARKKTKDTAALNKKLASTQRTCNDNSKHLEKVKEDLATKSSQINNLTLAGATAGSVAFEVRQRENPGTILSNAILKLDDVTLNKGGAYNPTSGKITAPVSGIYIFWADILGKGLNAIHVFLYKAGTPVVKSYTAYNVQYGTASLVYITHVMKGQQVWFAIHELGSKEISGNFHSSLGGTLLTKS